ncbi:toxin-antitoxin system HicB family antitoxin [Sinomonas terrae]|uniref:Toxin-antitoxin system HicB family antitoxin n=1 Tax=Sinomonas terrae TaxID=2908838 RepID=A0ABS9TVH1_9MICC|nr:toxin-antitoxin system HicB family antitoxin [Sinomonas terrae]MCH6468421.1 toxin-antitoxin system HicB family antitoxin [Sinomonas terrae]
MDLDRYVADLRSQLAVSAEAAGEEARGLAEQLSLALDSAARLALLEALSDAASEITRELAPGSVDVRLRGRDPEFVVSAPPATEFTDAPTPLAPAAPVETGNEDSSASADALDDTVTSRTTLRLPDQLKARVERAAAQDGISLNAWLVRAIAAALEPKPRRTAQRESRSGDSFTGWVR